MGENVKRLLSNDEIKEKLVVIYDEVKSQKLTYEEIMQKYNVGQYVLLDLNSMDSKEFNNLLDSIEDIKSNIQKRKGIRKISADLGCGSSVVGYIVKNTCEEYSKKSNSSLQFAELCKQTEQIWKQYKRGETVKNLSYHYNMNEKYLEMLLKNFEDTLKDKQKYYKGARKIIDLEEKKSKLKKRFNFDDDTIAYIVDGKPIDPKEDKKGIELDEQ